MESLNAVFAWTEANPAWGGIGVFLIACFESLALVGLILPGAAMMFGIGALVATDILPLWPTLAWAALGAIAGDGISFWLGRHYHMQLKTLWPLRNHPEIIASATQFFYRHGGKSVLLGRFIGPIRPVLPAVAGMLEMPGRRFVLFNVISGVLWAPVYVLPGMIFTTSLGLAAEVASRLAVMVGSMLAVAVLFLWLSRLAFNWLHRHTYPWMQRLLWWSRLHPLMGRIPASLLDPNQPEARGLTQLALLLLVATLLFAALIASLGEGGAMLASLDYNLHLTLHHLRTPGVDKLMLGASLLANIEVTATLSVAVLLWLLRRGLRHAAMHWLAAIGFGSLLGLALYLLGRHLHAEALTRHADSNSLLLFAITCFGFLAVLIARELRVPLRWPVYALTGLMLLMTLFARLYLEMLSLSALLGILSLGLAWISLLGIAYRNHPGERVSPQALSLLSLVAVSLPLLLLWPQLDDAAQQRLAYSEKQLEISKAQWRSGQIPSLPQFRSDLRGRHLHPLNLHYAGSLATLRQRLLDAGWQAPPAVDGLSWLAWLNPDTPLSQLPVLPQVHDGRYHSLLLTREVDGQLLALRLWRSAYRIAPLGREVWLGNVGILRAERRGGLTVPRTQMDYPTARRLLQHQLLAVPGIRLRQRPEALVLELEESADD